MRTSIYLLHIDGYKSAYMSFME